jgi:hypothetical protein
MTDYFWLLSSRLVLLEGRIGVLLIVRFIDLGVGNASDLFGGFLTVKHGGGLFEGAVLGLNDI